MHIADQQDQEDNKSEVSATLEISTLPGGVLINEDQNQIRFDINEIDGQSQISSGVKNRR